MNGIKRFHIINDFIRDHKLTRGAEVGTGNGKTAMELLKKNPELVLIEVAYYPGPRHLDKKHPMYCTTGTAKALWEKRIRRYRNRIKILPFPSVTAAGRVKDASLDFVFIDADHSYECCLEDIKAWHPKVRAGGLICGHDYHQRRFPGVVQAVDEFYGRDNIKLRQDRFWYLWKTV